MPASNTVIYAKSTVSGFASVPGFPPLMLKKNILLTVPVPYDTSAV
jgi:hypothetical protein